MKSNILKNLILSFAIILPFACTANYADINQDPYGASKEEFQRKGYGLRSSMSTMAGAIISLDVNTTQFTECLLGGPLAGVLADANPNFSNTISKYNPNDNWTNVLMRSSHGLPKVYAGYRDILINSENPVILAVAKVMKVAYMHRVTDAYGPIPYTKIKQNGDITVPYDSQEVVYTTMLQELDEALQVFKENINDRFVATTDIIYAGNVAKWAKYANSLKLRLAMRISYAKPDLSKQKAEEVANSPLGVIESVEDMPQITTFGNDGNPINVAVKYNEASEHPGIGGDTKVAADIICYMNGYKDPRREAYFVKSLWQGREYVGLRHGIEIPDYKTGGYKYSGVKIDKNSPLVLFSAAEASFLKAEAVAVFGYNMKGAAKDFYEKGVRLSFEQWGVKGADTYLADKTSKPEEYNDPSSKNSYKTQLTEMTVAWNESATKEQKQEKIMIQKWIANYLLANESWADMRRTGYPKIIPASTAGNKSNGVVDSNKGPQRIPYPSEEQTSNPVNYKDAVTNLLKGPDNMATKLWFVKK